MSSSGVVLCGEGQCGERLLEVGHQLIELDRVEALNAPSASYSRAAVRASPAVRDRRSAFASVRLRSDGYHFDKGTDPSSAVVRYFALELNPRRRLFTTAFAAT
jgi:hypothetical protein